MPEQSRFAKSLSSPWQWLALAIIFITLVLVAIGPKVYDRPHSHQNALLQCSHGIGLAMYAYANDNNGKYPTGNSSTEVFQKLVDRGYVTAPSIFYTSFVGIRSKSPANSNKLKPENVCWDVTVPADMNVSDPSLPLVFTTGYRIEYLSHGRALPLANANGYGIAAFYVSNAAWFTPIGEGQDGIVLNFIPAPFDAKGVKYVQLTPDGPLP